MAETKTKKPFFKTFAGNLLIILLLCVALYWIFFGSLSIITRHGDVKVVPDLKGMTIDSAMRIIEKEGFEIKIDSVYDKEYGLNEVIDQQPESGSKVKSGRILFLTVNKANPPLVAMPSLNGMTLRSAELELKKHRLELGDTLFIYDVADGTVIEMRYKGNIISSGTKIPEGAVIDITVSKGLSDETVAIPQLVGIPLFEAIKLLDEKDLRYRMSFDGAITDSSSAMVFYQYPESRNDYGEPLRVYKGDKIDFKVGQNPTIEKRTYQSRPASDPSSDNDNIVGSEESKQAPKENSDKKPEATDKNKKEGDKVKSDKKPEKKQDPLPPTYPTDNNKKKGSTNADKPKERPQRPNR